MRREFDLDGTDRVMSDYSRCGARIQHRLIKACIKRPFN